jgi:hypothetical protein
MKAFRLRRDLMPWLPVHDTSVNALCYITTGVITNMNETFCVKLQAKVRKMTEPIFHELFLYKINRFKRKLHVHRKYISSI